MDADFEGSTLTVANLVHLKHVKGYISQAHRKLVLHKTAGKIIEIAFRLSTLSISPRLVSSPANTVCQQHQVCGGRDVWEIRIASLRRHLYIEKRDNDVLDEVCDWSLTVAFTHKECTDAFCFTAHTFFGIKTCVSSSSCRGR